MSNKLSFKCNPLKTKLYKQIYKSLLAIVYAGSQTYKSLDLNDQRFRPPAQQK